jgi:hypothetical protein
VTGHLTYDANVARLEDLHGRAERRRMARRAARTSIPAATQTRVGVAEPVTIRRATAADRATLERLAALDSARAPVGDVLIAVACACACARPTAPRRQGASPGMQDG